MWANSRGTTPCLSLHRQDGSHSIQMGRLDWLSCGKSKPKKAKVRQRDHHARVHLVKVVLMVVRQGG
jgi:hypothetical protein